MNKNKIKHIQRQINNLQKQLDMLTSEEEVLKDIVITESFKGINLDKSNTHRLIKTRKGTTITCEIKHMITGNVIGRGIARLNPEDNMDIKFGSRLAELRARENWYKKSQDIIINNKYR